MIAEAVDDYWETRAICMLRGNADKLMDELTTEGDGNISGIYNFYLFRVPQDLRFHFPIVGQVTEHEKLLKNGCLTLKVVE